MRRRGAGSASLDGPSPFPTAAFAVLVVALVVALVDVAVVPILLHEGSTDWRAYDEAARALAAHQPLYPWAATAEIRDVTAYPYLYPPALAAIWGLGLTAPMFAVIKVLSVGTMAVFARPASGRSWTAPAVAAAVAVVALTLASPPLIHDVILGNVMTLYLAATALAVALPDRRWAAVPLGILTAVALKPAIAAVLLWLLVRRPAQFVTSFGAGLVTTVLFAAVVGIGPYVDYLAALPKLGGLAQPFSGNLGLSAISLTLALAAIPIALAWVVLAAGTLDAWSSAAVAVALTLIVQPTLGLNYAVLLAPAIAALWFVDRRACLAAGILAPFLTLVSPPLAGVVVAGIASGAGWRLRRAGRIAAPVPAGT